MSLEPFGPEPLLTCRPESGSGFSPPASIQTPDPSLVTFSGSAACLSEKCRNLKLLIFVFPLGDRSFLWKHEPYQIWATIKNLNWSIKWLKCSSLRPKQTFWRYFLSAQRFLLWGIVTNNLISLMCIYFSPDGFFVSMIVKKIVFVSYLHDFTFCKRKHFCNILQCLK